MTASPNMVRTVRRLLVQQGDDLARFFRAAGRPDIGARLAQIVDGIAVAPGAEVEREAARWSAMLEKAAEILPTAGRA